MAAQTDSTSNKMISGLLITAGMSGLFFATQALATDYVITNGQLAPNPNQAGDVIHINGSASNSNDYENTGAIELNNGANLTNSAFNFSPVFINRQAGTLTNTGRLITPFEDGGWAESPSHIGNHAILINTDIGTTLRNLNGAVFDNGFPSGLIFPQPPSDIYSPSAAVFSNRQGATVTNSGVYGVTFSGYTNFQSSAITNYATFTNSDAGSSINNENGAALNNGGNSYLPDDSSATTMLNNNGGVMNNSGVYTWQNETGYPGYISSSMNNHATFSNSGESTRLNNLNGAVLNNGAQGGWGFPAAPNTVLTNENGATLTNSGAFTQAGVGGYINLVQSTVNNLQAMLLNTGTASQLINRNGGVINNTGASWFDPSSNPGVLNNENGAILTNSGAYVWQDETGVAKVSQTSIINSTAIITNSGVGSRLENLNGALLLNGGFGWIGSSDTTLINQNGATLTNSGAYHLQDENVQSQTTASMINNHGSLINTGTGTVLNNLSGAELVNEWPATLKNEDGALLANGAGATFRNQGRIINDALMTNAGSFQAGGSIVGGGRYVQTAGETMLGGGLSEWTQASTEIQGGVLRGNGTLIGTVIIEGGTLASGNPDNFSSGFPLTHPGLTINGDLSFNSGLIKINVGSDGLPIFGGFGNPFDIANQGNGGLPTFDPFTNLFPVNTGNAVSDALTINGSASFSGGVVEINFLNGYVPYLGESLAWLTATGGITGLENIQYSFTGLANNRSLAFNHDGNHLTWTVASVPLPAAGWFFIAGLLGMLQSSRPKIRSA